MFDFYSDKKESGVRKFLRRVGISLGAGLLLTFIFVGLLEAIWPYLGDNHREFAVILGSILNLPAVIYCSFFSLPEQLHPSDESLYCYSVGFFFNPLYYATVIFIIWYLKDAISKRRRRHDFR